MGRWEQFTDEEVRVIANVFESYQAQASMMASRFGQSDATEHQLTLRALAAESADEDERRSRAAR